MHIKLILGDQLTFQSPLFESQLFEPPLSESPACEDKSNTDDMFVMIEATGESTRPASSNMRTTLFLSAMRHFAKAIKEKGLPLSYLPLSAKCSSITQGLEQVIKANSQSSQSSKSSQPIKISVVLPGDTRLVSELKAFADDIQCDLNILPDPHFLAQQGEFKQWISQYKKPRMEYWYRHLRKRLNILLDAKGKPEGGSWNYDKDNRKAFTKQGPPKEPAPLTFEEDDLTRTVKKDIAIYLPDLYGSNDQCMWPVTREDALALLNDFVDHRLVMFGDYQDAMWQDEPFLYHSLLSSSLNLKLLNPLEVIQAAVNAYESEKAPLNAVEGFIRQIAGWREYVRGLYWLKHDQWEHMNGLDHQHELPDFYWQGDTPMHCMSQSIKQVLTHGYGHHIQRLMVTGLFALLYRVKPQAVHEWYLAMYIDAVAWVEVPNTLGMSQYADDGFLASKPYIASGAYISRMSNYCKDCRFNPKQAEGESACPFTTLYWDFVSTHEDMLSQNPRLGMQVKNWHNKSKTEQDNIKQRAQLIFKSGGLLDDGLKKV